jgi:hypothetical protein
VELDISGIPVRGVEIDAHTGCAQYRSARDYHRVKIQVLLELLCLLSLPRIGMAALLMQSVVLYRQRFWCRAISPLRRLGYFQAILPRGFGRSWSHLEQVVARVILFWSPIQLRKQSCTERHSPGTMF